MYTMLRANGLIPTVKLEMPTGIAAFAIAEVFYKFHSFTLECFAFLATWFIFSWLASTVSGLFSRPDRE